MARNTTEERFTETTVPEGAHHQIIGIASKQQVMHFICNIGLTILADEIGFDAMAREIGGGDFAGKIPRILADCQRLATLRRRTELQDRQPVPSPLS